MKTVAMIPARMGSQRLAKKNLRNLHGVPLITRAVRKCLDAGCFDSVWVNSADADFGDIAAAEGANFHRRPDHLGDNDATSEDFVAEFLENVQCDRVAQVHSIAPLLTDAEIRGFMHEWEANGADVMLSCIYDQIEVAYRGIPVNFTFAKKTNSQNLEPVQRITWSITGWRRETFLAARARSETATYSGRIGFFPVSAISGHVIKTEQDLRVAEALFSALYSGGRM